MIKKESGLLFELYNNILANSWVPQPELAMGASIMIMSTVIGRKYTYLNNCANLYTLHIGKSGSGKDAPQQAVKNTLLKLGMGNKIGAGMYVSDASLTDNLENQPVRLDVIDEAAGFLAMATDSSGSSFSRNIPDILCELFTSSNEYYPGRMLAKGEHKGACVRPYVNVLMSTTPRGFREGFNASSLEKGLMGRFLLFFTKNVIGGPPKNVALPQHVCSDIQYVASRSPQDDKDMECVITKRFGGEEHSMYEATIDSKTQIRANSLFSKYRTLTVEADDENPIGAVYARAFQMCCKLALIHCVSRDPSAVEPKISLQDLDFAEKVVDRNLKNFANNIEKNVFISPEEEAYSDIREYIKLKKFVTKYQLANAKRKYSSRLRKQSLTDLRDYGMITEGSFFIDGKKEWGYLWSSTNTDSE